MKNIITAAQDMQPFNEQCTELGSENLKKKSVRHRILLFRCQQLMGDIIKLRDILCKVLRTLLKMIIIVSRI